MEQGEEAKIEGYRVAGKTGTAEKYVPGKYVVSYMGFAPVDDPKLAILVIIDEPSQAVLFMVELLQDRFFKK
jgi:stage V sporulation protein D (sporulation-specific penicillin-binding protein)